MSGGYSAPSPLRSDHELADFRCGQPALDEWLQRYAFTNQRANMTKTFVTTPKDSDAVVGYYALATGAVARHEAPARITQGTAQHPVPVVLLARLATHEDHTHKGLGSGLLRDALIRVLNVSEEVAVRALLIHAKDENARDFYMAQAEFEPSPVDPLQLMLLTKDLEKAIEG